MTFEGFSLAEILAVAKIHPFYNPNAQYPPGAETIESAVHQAAKQSTDIDLSSVPLISKKDLYKVIARLTDDTSRQNEYRRSSYISITGGGSGGLPLMFMTDARENRKHRAVFGKFIGTCRVAEPYDWILTTHCSGYFYRSLDLTSELMENAGATVLSAGNYMTPAEVVRALAHYHVNVLAGDGSQVVQVVHHISTLPAEEREKIKLTKVIYTSEPLTEMQCSHITATLGPVKICSILGSAEAGPCALSHPDLTVQDGPAGTMDFVFDTRQVIIEILPPSSAEEGASASSRKPLPDGEEGIIVQTSLQRRRNPLVRYITGDIGSLHPLPERARAIIPKSEWEHLRVLRLRGRDRRFSFKWFAMYFEFEKIVSLMQGEKTGILQWQLILATLESSAEIMLEIRLLHQAASEHIMSREEVVRMLETFFFILDENRHLFRITFLDSLAGFEKSRTGNKVIKFVDKAH
ncbi:hypothetical protein MAP00_008513 [Monascus purpureus]|nr:hypothetical protein MAP00_008513 [Monascus purpureus]